MQSYLFFWKNSNEYNIWYDIKLCLHKQSHDNIAPFINFQEVIYLFRRIFFLIRSWNQYGLIPCLFFILTIKELWENLMAICITMESCI